MKFRSGPDHGEVAPEVSDEDVLIVEGLRIAFELSRRQLLDKLRAGGKYEGNLRLDVSALAAAPPSLLLPETNPYGPKRLIGFLREWQLARRATARAATREGWDFRARLRMDRACFAIAARLSFQVVRYYLGLTVRLDVIEACLADIAALQRLDQVITITGR